MRLSRSVILLLSTVLAMLMPGLALACRCSQQSLDTYFQQADWVARVTVEAVQEPEEVDGMQARAMDIQVLEKHKGAAPLTRLYSADSHAACGMVLLPGSEYWAFAHNRHADSDKWWIDSCSGTRPVGAGYRDTEAENVAATLASLAGKVTAEENQQALIQQRIALTTIGQQAVTAQMVEQFALHSQVSPNGVWRFIVLKPPAASRPPRQLKVIVEREQQTLLELSLTGEDKLGKIEWVNEKLVLVVVHWDPLHASELLVDVESGQIIYAR